MKKLIGTMIGCVAAYYAIDYIGVLGMAGAWDVLVESGNIPAANALDDAFHKRFCKRNQKVFDLCKKAFTENMKKEH